MNVAALLQDSPSEDHARRRQQAQQAQQQAQAQQQTSTQQQQPQPHHRSSPPSPRDHPSFPPSFHDSHRPPPLPTLPPPPQVVRHAQPPLPPAPPHRTQRAPSPEFYAPPPPHGYPPPSDYDPRKHAHRPPSDEFSSRRGPALPSPPYAVGRPPPPPPNIRPGHIPHAHTPHGGSPMYLPPPPVPQSTGPPPSSAMGMHHPHRSVDYISSPSERERERDKERGHLERERYRERDRDRERERDRDRDRERERDTQRMPPGKAPYLPGPSGPSPPQPPQPPQPPHQSPIHEPSSMYTGHPAQAHFAPPPPPSSARPGRSAPMASLQSDAGPGARHVGGPPPVPGPGPPPPHHSHRDLGPNASLASVGMHHSAQGFGVPGLGREESSAMAMGRERERDRDMREREREMIERDRDRAREREMVEREREGRRKGRGSVSGGRHTPIGMGLPSAFPPAPAPDPRMGPKEREREREMRQREDMDFIRKAAAQRRADEGQGPPRMERERDRDMMHALGGQQHQQIPKSKSSSSLGSSTSVLNLASGPGPGLSPPKGHGDPMQHQGRPPFTPAPYPPERRKQGPGPSPPHPQPHIHHHAHAHLHAHIHHPHPKDAPPGSGVSTPHTHVLHHGHHPHPHQHHQHQLLGAYPPAHRRSPPPFHAQAYAHGPGALMPAPALPPLHLGAFVFPATPFPYHFPASPAREVRATLLIPAGFLPAERPARPRLWGGAAGAGMSAFVERRVYTDDSDVVCAAVHAGFVPWSTLARAAREGRDLRLDVRLSREVRYVGGVGARLRGLEPESVEEEEGGEDDDGRGFVSAGWGNGHDGSGFEILGIAFLEKGTAHKAPGLGRKNRKQRLAEYAEGRCAVLGVQNNGKRKRRMMMGQLDPNVLEDEETRAARMSIVFGEWGEGGDVELGFKYDPDVLRSALFDPPPTAIDSPRKRRRLAASASGMDVDAAEPEDGDVPRTRDVILETACERFLVAAYESPPEEDKENEAGAPGSSRRRWAISLVGKAGAAEGTAPVVDAVPVESKHVKSDETKADAPSSDDVRPPIQPVSDTAPPAPPDDKEPQKTQTTEPDKAAIPDSALPKLLQRDITEANFDFAPDEVRILGAPDAEGVRSGWAIEVRRWRWA